MTELRALSFLGLVLFGAQMLLGRLTLGTSFGLGICGLTAALTGFVMTRRRASRRRPVVRALVMAYALLAVGMVVVLALTVKWFFIVNAVSH